MENCAANTNFTEVPDLRKFYCPTGTTERLIAPVGYYTEPDSSRDQFNRRSKTECPDEGNKYCPGDGTQVDIMNTNDCRGLT
jgi:hypothetical protein